MNDNRQLRIGLRLCAALLGLLPVSRVTANPATLESVITRDGPVHAAADNGTGVSVFRGIPYAATTAGSDRWRPPRPPAPWHDTVTADHFGPECPQPNSVPSLASERPQSEDCLSLNVWTPAHSRADDLPVMVWIHGGAFIAGSSASYLGWTDPAPLAAQGVVLVTLNYRLGLFGFFAHPQLVTESPHHSAGNYGLLDVVAALRWVKANIAAFGGNPHNVTIFGQSAGSEIVTILLATPGARGLFHKAIGESGASLGWRTPKSLREAQAAGVDFMQQVGAHSIAELRSMSADKLLAAVPAPFEPVVDGRVYPRSLYQSIASGHWNAVPLLVGSNADEGQYDSRMTLSTWTALVRRRYGPYADEVLARYGATTDELARAANKTLFTAEADAIESTIVQLIECHPEIRPPPVFQYHFDHAPPGSPDSFGRSGAYHGAEVAYVFRSLEQQDRHWTDADRRLEHLLSGYWVNFARSGNVNGPGLPHWPDSREQPAAVMTFADDAVVDSRKNGAAIAFLQRIYYGRDLHSCGS